MVLIKRFCIALVALALTAPGLTAQEEMAQDMEPTADRPIPAGIYTFVPSESDDIGPMAREAVSHLFFAIRGIARRRLEGANEPIDRIEIRYQGDTLMVSLRDDEPIVKTLMTGDSIPYTRADGEVVQVSTEVEPGMMDMYFIAEDGQKQMIYQLREDGYLAVESVTYSDKLEEPFRYTWVYEAASGGM